MKTRIARLVPHQNGIVVGVLMGAASLVFVVPAYLLMQTAPLIDPALVDYAIPKGRFDDRMAAILRRWTIGSPSARAS